jgi:hypothetical protein
MIATRDVPQLTAFGIGVHYSYYRWQSKEAVVLEIQKQQSELSTERALRMGAFCVDWIKENRKYIHPSHSSYFYSHRVEQHRRDGGDPDPYIHNGAFIAAGVGLGLNWTIEGPNVMFRLPPLRQSINRILACDGQRLHGTVILQTHDGPMMMPCRPHVVRHGVDVLTLARELGVL